MLGSIAQPAAPDMLNAVAARMRRQGIAGLPRNYELVYEAIAGGDGRLDVELQKLGSSPSQNGLDELARRHLGHGDADEREDIVESAYQGLLAKLDEITALLTREQRALDKYGMVLSQTSEGLSGQELSRALLGKISGILATATTTKIKQGRQIASTLADKTSELDEVKSKLEEYKHLAETDALTQLANRRAFDRRMADIYQNPKAVLFTGLIVLDVDLFKGINDRRGHQAGDQVLQALGRVMGAALTGDMFLARIGGEEFAVIVEGLSLDTTVQLAERIRADVEKTAFMDHGSDPVTVSVGVCMASEARSAEGLYAKADEALYASKANGRNRVSTYPLPAALQKRKSWYMYRTE